MKKVLLGVAAILSIAPVLAFAQSPSSCVSITHNLTYGSRDSGNGGDVTTLQNFLQSQGYLSSNATGYFGSLTQGAVKAFQATNSVSNTGYVGPLTRAKISTVSCAGGTANSNSASSGTQTANTSGVSASIVSPTSGQGFVAGQTGTISWNANGLNPNKQYVAEVSMNMQGTAGNSAFYLSEPCYTTLTSPCQNTTVTNGANTSSITIPSSSYIPSGNYQLNIRVIDWTAYNASVSKNIVAAATATVGPIFVNFSTAAPSGSAAIISSVIPAQASASTFVTAYGSNISGVTNVQFYNSFSQLVASVVPSYVSSTSTVFALNTAPAYSLRPGTYQIGLLNSAGISNLANFTLISTAVPAPAISSTSPSNGAPGDKIVVKGKNLLGVNEVDFYDANNQFIGSINNNNLRDDISVSPDGLSLQLVLDETFPAGTYQIRVVNTAGSSNTLPFTTIVTPSTTINQNTLQAYPGGGFAINGKTILPNGLITVALVGPNYTSGTDWGSVSYAISTSSYPTAIAVTGAISNGNWSGSFFNGVPTAGSYAVMVYDSTYTLLTSGTLIVGYAPSMY